MRMLTFIGDSRNSPDFSLSWKPKSYRKKCLFLSDTKESMFQNYLTKFFFKCCYFLTDYLRRRNSCAKYRLVEMFWANKKLYFDLWIHFFVYKSFEVDVPVYFVSIEKNEYSAVIKFFVLEGLSATKSQSKMVKVLKESAPSFPTLHQWSFRA